MTATTGRRSSHSRPGRDREVLLEWVERVAMYFNEQGLAPITGRILGWLLACDPPEQSGGEISEAIGASRASIATNVRLLTAAGLVRRLVRPGGRTAYFVIEDDAWERLIRLRAERTASFREITRDGIELLGADNERARRMRIAHESFDWYAALLANAPPVPHEQRGGR